MITGYSRNLLIINGAALLGCAVFDFAWQNKLLLVLLLLLPFLDRDWSLPTLVRYHYQWLFWSICILLTGLIHVLNIATAEPLLLVLVFTAIPEEWFFRAYFMQRLEALNYGRWTANIATSILFAILHVPVQGLSGLSVFIPSLLFGWLYQRNRDLVLVVLLHTLFNGMFIFYLRDVMN